MKRNIAVFLATFFIVAFLFLACFAALFLFFGGTSPLDTLERAIGSFAEHIAQAPTLGERLDEKTAEAVASAVDSVIGFYPIGRRITVQNMLMGVFFLKF